MSIVFSGLSALVIEDVQDAGEVIVVRARTSDEAVACPDCGTPTARVHGYHERVAADVPFDGRRVLVRLMARRMRCPVTGCPRQTFREQVPGVIDRYQRRTARLAGLDHYLEALMRKPGAMPGSVALGQARAAGAFTPAHEAFWSAARRALGEPAATRELIEVLLLHRHMNDADVIAGIGAALSVGAHAADVVAVEARKVADTRGSGRPATATPGGARDAPPDAQVTSLTLRRIAALPADSRPLPSVDAYDQLLRQPRTSSKGQP